MPTKNTQLSPASRRSAWFEGPAVEEGGGRICDALIFLSLGASARPGPGTNDQKYPFINSKNPRRL